MGSPHARHVLEIRYEWQQSNKFNRCCELKEHLFEYMSSCCGAHTDMHTRVHAHTHILTPHSDPTHPHTDMHTYTHTHTHIHTHTACSSTHLGGPSPLQLSQARQACDPLLLPHAEVLCSALPHAPLPAVGRALRAPLVQPLAAAWHLSGQGAEHMARQCMYLTRKRPCSNSLRYT